MGVSSRTTHDVSVSCASSSAQVRCSTTWALRAARATVPRPPSPTGSTPPQVSQPSRVSTRRSSRNRSSNPYVLPDAVVCPTQYGLGPPRACGGRGARAGRDRARSGLTPSGRSSTRPQAACRRRGVASTGAGESNSIKTVVGMTDLPGP